MNWFSEYLVGIRDGFGLAILVAILLTIVIWQVAERAKNKGS